MNHSSLRLWFLSDREKEGDGEEGRSHTPICIREGQKGPFRKEIHEIDKMDENLVSEEFVCTWLYFEMLAN